jgi:hypothetical protein
MCPNATSRVLYGAKTYSVTFDAEISNEYYYVPVGTLSTWSDMTGTHTSGTGTSGTDTADQKNPIITIGLGDTLSITNSDTGSHPLIIANSNWRSEYGSGEPLTTSILESIQPSGLYPLQTTTGIVTGGTVSFSPEHIGTFNYMCIEGAGMA